MLTRCKTEQRTPASVSISRAVWSSFLHPEHDLRSRASLHLTQGTPDLPILMIFGRYDPVISPSKDGREAHKALPNAEVHVMQTGHVPFAEAPEAFLTLVRGFLARVISQRQLLVPQGPMPPEIAVDRAQGAGVGD